MELRFERNGALVFSRRFLTRDAAVQLQISALRFLAYALRMRGDFSEMARVLDSSIAMSEATGERWNRAEVLGLRWEADYNVVAPESVTSGAPAQRSS